MLHVKLHLNYRDPLTADSAERGFCKNFACPGPSSFKISRYESVLSPGPNWSWSSKKIQVFGPTGPWIPASIDTEYKYGVNDS